MTHKCFRCDQRFKSSGQLVCHMQEAHPSFVQDAQDKIDRSKEQYSHSFVNSAATCPYCQMNCHTRKKLMKHLEEHKDLEPEPEEETELKIIKITNENKRSLLDQFDGDKAGSSGAGSSNDTTSANGPNFVKNLIHALETDPAKIASSKIKVSSTSLKLPERRYKCFWCDTSFRKRGKLMDHIDMFHKANKHQSELEAELLQGVSRDISVHEAEKPKSIAIRQSSNSSVVPSSNRNKDTAVCRSKSNEKHLGQPTKQTIKSKRKCCTFNMVGTISGGSKASVSATPTSESSCKFFFGTSGNLHVKRENTIQDLGEACSSVQADEKEQSTAQVSQHSNKRRSASFSSSCSLTQSLSSPQMHLPAASIPNFALGNSTFQTAAAQPLSCAAQQLTQLSAQSQTLAQSLFPPLPYYLPPSDLYLNQQHNMIMEQQRSQLQYLSYMQSLVSQNAIDPNRPLDLSKGNF